MLKSLPLNFLRLLIATSLFLALIAVLSACSPRHDWREVHGTDAPYVALLPAKPVTHARPIDLDGIAVTMTMTAAQVDDATYAVGNAKLPDPSAAPAALKAMKTALVKNINGTVIREAAVEISGQPMTVELEAVGVGPNQQSLLLVGRFVAKDDRVYQAIVVGPEKSASREAIDTFFIGFKLQ